MGAFVVEGQHRLQGTVRINGAKNSALKLMVAALLGQGVFNLENVPRITDVHTMAGVMDSTATSLCMDNNIPMIVFNFDEPGSIEKAIRGSRIGTYVGGE
jgi:UDP-N-acetylglucosamine enolpyruvyl transferase